MNIYVGNLPKSTNEQAVKELFEVHGEVTEVKLLKDHYTNELRGFGFVTMPSKTDALKAIKEINSVEMEGRVLIVNEAKPQKNQTGGNRRGGGGHRGGGHRGDGHSRSWQ